MAAALLWLVAALIYRLGGFETPVLLPVLGIAALMAWCQALSWLPIKSPWLRTAVALGSVLFLGGLPLWLDLFDPSSPAGLATLLISYIAAAFAVGLAALVNDRRGNIWRLWPGSFRLDRITTWPARVSRRRPFRSPAAAQLWYECNCHGLVLPLFVGVMMVLFLATKLSAGPRINSFQVPLTLALFLGMPVIVAGSTSSIHGRLRPFWVDTRGFMTFLAIRPTTSASLVAAKFRMALMSAFWSWVIAVAGTVTWVFASYDTANVAALAREFFERYPGGRGVTILALAGVLFPALIWRHLTDWIAPRLSGRRSIAEGGAWVYAVVIIILASGGVRLMFHPEDRPLFIAAVPWLVVSAALCKGGLAIGTFKAALRRRLMSWPAIWGILGLWLALTACAVGMAALLIPPGASVSWPILSLGIGAFVPLVRFPLATLALDWNRHR
jgi:hypothetical protein